MKGRPQHWNAYRDHTVSICRARYDLFSCEKAELCESCKVAGSSGQCGWMLVPCQQRLVLGRCQITGRSACGVVQFICYFPLIRVISYLLHIHDNIGMLPVNQLQTYMLRSMICSDVRIIESCDASWHPAGSSTCKHDHMHQRGWVLPSLGSGSAAVRLQGAASV